MKKKVLALLLVSGFVFTRCGSSGLESNTHELMEAETFEEAKTNINKDSNDTDLSITDGESIDSENISETPFHTDLNNNSNSPLSITFDDLQQLYIDLDPSLSYSEMIEFIQETDLPFSEEKYNGSRKIQISFTKDGTSQSFMKEPADYVEIIYNYPENENSINDDFDKYSFGTAAYIPESSSMELIFHQSGHFFSYNDPGCYISDLGTRLDLDKDMTREEQFEYYFSHLQP